MATEVLPDPRALRSGRRERALAQMDEHGLDILVLGRQANIRYVTGAPQLWIAGTRPFGPMCVLVRATQDIYLNSTDDEGVPEEIDHDHLYGLAWNPMTLIDVLKKVDGAESARRVGTDAITPTFAALLPEAFPNAELVDAEPAMRAARRIKTPDEIAAMGTALRVAECGLASALAELAPGASQRTLAGVMMEAMAAGGVSTPATQDAAWVTSREQPWRRASAHEIRSGDLVAFAAGALADGYVAEWDARGRPAMSSAARRVSSSPARTHYTTRCLPPVAPARPPEICWPPMRRSVSRYRRCRSRTGWGWVSTRPSYPKRCWPRGNTTNSRRAWCWRSPATCGGRASARCSAATPSTSPRTASTC